MPNARDDIRVEVSVNQSIVSYFTRRERDKKRRRWTLIQRLPCMKYRNYEHKN